jgi:cysteine desulfurase
MGRIYYLDHAAATPCDERVVQAMQPYLSELFYNPSSSYGGGQEAHDALEGARADIAGLIGAKPDDIVFTAGATESINLAIHGALSGGGSAIISAVEHVAVRAAVERFPYDIAAVDAYGMTRVEDIEKLVTDETRLVSVVLADNEFGTVQPIAEIARLVESIRSDRQQRGVTEPIYLFCDASQGQTALDINVARLGADMLTLNAGKCYGPKQVGLLWLRSSVQIEPLIRGGGQERNLRNGTENVAGAVGFACALELAQKGRYSESERLREIKYALRNQLEATVEGIEY